MSDLVRVVQYGIDVLVRNDVEDKADINTVLADALEKKGLYVCGITCEGYDGEYPGLDDFLADAHKNFAKYSGSVPPSYGSNPEVGHANTRELEIVRYLKGQGHPHPEEDGTLDEFMYGGERQAMYDEAVKNNYDLPDVNRWFHLVDVMGIDLKFETAMKIDRALYEEDLETMELLLPMERVSLEDKLESAVGRCAESAPDLFEQAFVHYSAIDRSMADYKDYLKYHGDKLIYCFQNNLSLDLLDVDFWVQYEHLLGERLSFDEYSAIDGSFDGDPHEIEDADSKMISEFRATLEKHRESRVKNDKVGAVQVLIDGAKERSDGREAGRSVEKDLGDCPL